MEILTVVVTKEMIPSVITKNLSCKECEITNVTNLVEPMQFIELEIRIKRAFGLPPRVIPQNYMVDLRTGTMFRVKGTPEQTDFEYLDYTILQPTLSSEEASNAVRTTAFKYATRAYKFFWKPDIVITNQEKFHLLIWEVKYSTEKQDGTFWINSYTGQVSIPEITGVSSDIQDNSTGP